MKRYINSSETVDRNLKAEQLKQHRGKEKNLNTILEQFEKAFAKSKLSGCTLESLKAQQGGWFSSRRDTTYRAIYTLSGVVIKYQEMTILIRPNLTESEIYETILNDLNEAYEKGDIVTDSEISENIENRRDICDEIVSFIDDSYAKYDITGHASIPDKFISDVKKDLVHVYPNVTSICGLDYHTASGYKQSYVTYRNRKYEIHSFNFYTFINDYKHELPKMENTICEVSEEVRYWISVVDYLESNGHRIDSEVRNMLENFQYEDVYVDNIEVKDISDEYYGRYITEHPVDEMIEISFDLYGYNGQIDLQVRMTYAEWKSTYIEKKLVNMIKYGKRKYGIR